MKRILTTTLMAAGLTGLFVTTLAAQHSRTVADIPFSFVVGDRTLPAGQYEVSQHAAGSSLFALRDGLGHGIFVNFNSQEDGKPGNPSLTFACYGQTHILSKVTPPNSVTAYALSKDSIERKLQHTLGMASMISIKLAPR